VSESGSSDQDGAAAFQSFFQTVSEFSTPLCVKVYRLSVVPPTPLPVLPCLDHEAMLHEGILPHAAAYVQDHASGDLHELVFVPAERRVEVDTVSTWGECSPEAHRLFLERLRRALPDAAIQVRRPSRLRGERRVATACRAQVKLRDVLLGDDLERTGAAIGRLQTIGALMEKQSRVASWGARTIMTPLLAVVGFLAYQILGRLGASLGADLSEFLQYVAVGVTGAYFLYYGLKAVQLTEMANRVWKRSAEYALIVAERRRLRAAADRPTDPSR